MLRSREAPGWASPPPSEPQSWEGMQPWPGYLLQQDKQPLCRTSKNSLACTCLKPVAAENRGCLDFTLLHLFSLAGWLLILQVTLHKSPHGHDHLGQFLVLQHIKLDLFKVICQLCPYFTQHMAVSKAPYSNIPV